jgi:ribulose-5-phosphate 4-epimerase/fuculose-1-phosphate aldolase
MREDDMNAVTTSIPISPAEAALRIDLAAAYRLVALFGWDDLIATHISVRLPEENAFLINPFGMLFEEIRPADLIKVDMDGKLLSPTKWSVNIAAFVIHSAIHRARHDALCAVHLHTADGVAVSMLEEGLLMLNQTAMLLAGDIAFHEYEGIVVNLDEQARLVADLGDKTAMILRNHGTLTVGRSIAEAFYAMFVLETACTYQVRALSMGRPLHMPSKAALDFVADLKVGASNTFAGELVWPALLRKLDRADPSWRGTSEELAHFEEKTFETP